MQTKNPKKYEILVFVLFRLYFDIKRCRGWFCFWRDFVAQKSPVSSVITSTWFLYYRDILCQFIEASKYHSVSLSAELWFYCHPKGGQKNRVLFNSENCVLLKFYHYNAYNIPSKSKKQQKKMIKIQNLA